jgi:hypothetical protein
MAAEMRDRVGETGAVHVQAELARLGQLADRRHFVGRVGEAIFGGVGDRDRVRLDLVDVVADRIDHRADRVGRQLGARAGGGEQLGAVGVEFGRAAFVAIDVRIAVADHAAVRRAERRQREAVGRRAGWHPQHADLRAEQIGKGAVEPLRPAIAVIGGVERVRVD